ncbi:MAG: host attachment protein [Alphaproteobacteria bacterium]
MTSKPSFIPCLAAATRSPPWAFLGNSSGRGVAMKKMITWVVLADGARARLLVNEGPGKGLTHERDFAGDRLKTRDIGSDKPGRAFDSVGESRHAKEPPSDPHRYNETDFARYLAGHLDDARKRGQYDRLVLVAPPRALGDLRSALVAEVRDRVIAELNKDLITEPLEDIARHLGAVLAV